jgi:glycosyltransferase involved in cell wall biosynthesis
MARLGQYVPYLRAAGHAVVCGVLNSVPQGGLLPNALAVEYGPNKVLIPEIVYVQRLMVEGVADAFVQARKHGQIIVSDVDDWYWGLSPENMAFSVTHPKNSPKENISHYKKSIGKSSYITVSTPFLRDKIAAFSGVPTTLLTNYVVTKRFNKVQMTDTTTPEVGWVGSTRHRSGDLETLRGVLTPMAARGDIRLVHSGDVPNTATFREKVGIPDSIDIRLKEATMVQDYPSLLDFEVGIVPLRDIPFNHAKSDIKGLEYAASGIPFVASDLPSYHLLNKSWSDLGNAGHFVAKNPAQWAAAINKLRDPVLRKEFQEALLVNVRTRDVAIGAKKLIRYRECLKPR